MPPWLHTKSTAAFSMFTFQIVSLQSLDHTHQHLQMCKCMGSVNCKCMHSRRVCCHHLEWVPLSDALFPSLYVVNTVQSSAGFCCFWLLYWIHSWQKDNITCVWDALHRMRAGPLKSTKRTGQGRRISEMYAFICVNVCQISGLDFSKNLFTAKNCSLKVHFFETLGGSTHLRPGRAWH